MSQYDVVVIGAGIAGASVASELARDKRVLLIEREETAGYHTTGRSAALFTPTYGPEQIRALTRASAAFFTQPDPQFCSLPLVQQRDVILLARAEQEAELEAAHAALSAETEIVRLDAMGACAMHPLIRPTYAKGGLLNRDSYDIDVDVLHRSWLTQFTARGGEIALRSPLVALRRLGADWEVETPARTVRTPWVVNASGAWADEVATMAGARPVGLVPKRRTVAVVATPEGVGDLSASPMLIDIGEQFFLKPQAGRLLVSPADATPSPPCDARPEEWDIAVGIDRVQQACALDVRRVESAWAGLRCFVPDGLPVLGEDDAMPGFFWLCGQGGYGIQTAPAMSRLAASMLRGDPVPPDLVDQGVNLSTLQPRR